MFSRATFCRYSWARCTGFRVWKPTIVAHSRSALALRTSRGVRSYPGKPVSGRRRAVTPPPTAQRPEARSRLTPGCASSPVP